MHVQDPTRAPTSSEPSLDPSSGGRFAELSPADRLDAVVELSGALAAVQAELGAVIAAAGAAGDWSADGATDLAAWLVAHCAISRATATTWARTATALEELPSTRTLLATGTASLDQVAAVAPVLTPADDAEVAAQIPGWTVRQCQAWARRRRPPTERDATRDDDGRHFTWHRDRSRGGCRYRGYLPADMAEAVNTALTRMADEAGPDPETGRWAPAGRRCADALHRLCGGESATPQVVVHVDADTLVRAHGAGGGQIGEVALARSTVLRHLCDARIEHAVHGPDGTTIGIGRNAKAPPGWLRRAVLRRDVHCRFPGCDRAVQHLHHVRHWTRDQGPTDASNLLGLCWRHHRLLHEGGWDARGDADHDITFVTPEGRTYAPGRDRGPILATTRRRLLPHLDDPP